MDVWLHRRKDGKLEASIDWEKLGFGVGDRLIRYLKENFGARVIDRIKTSPTGERMWKLQIEGHTIVVWQIEWGETLDISAEDPSGESLVERIAESVQRDMD